MDSVDKAYPGSGSEDEFAAKKIKKESARRFSLKTMKEKLSIRCIAFNILVLLFLMLFLCLIASFAMAFSRSSYSGKDFLRLRVVE